jgi:RNA polymerase sigma-70 factor (ECF subfamily)
LSRSKFEIQLFKEGRFWRNVTTDEVNAFVKERLLACQRGETTREDTFEEIIEAIHPHVVAIFRYVYAITAEEDQDDLFQEVMLRFVRSEAVYDSDQPILPWLYAIARNVRCDAAVRSQRRRDKADGQKASHPLNPGDFRMVPVNADQKIGIERALATLPESDREIVWLKYYAGCTEHQIANHLKMRLTTVKFYLLRSKRSLYSILRGRASSAAGVRAGVQL